MDKIHIVADEETVKAFHIAAIEGTVSSPETVRQDIEDIIAKGDSILIMISSEYIRSMDRFIYKINQDRLLPVIIEIPSIIGKETEEKSVMDYITEAIGFSL